MTDPQTLTNDYRDELYLRPAFFGGVYLNASNARGDSLRVGPFPIADLRAALDALDPQEAEDEGDTCHCGRPVRYGCNGDPSQTRGLCDDCDTERCDAYPDDCPYRHEDEPAPTAAPTAPTAEDFAQAQFAVHENGRFGARVEPGNEAPWVVAKPNMPASSWWNRDVYMAEDGWTIVTPAPTTPEDALAHFVSLLHEPEGDTIPAGTPCVYVDTSGGGLSVFPSGLGWDAPPRDDEIRRYLLHPIPAPEPEPEWVKAPAVWVRFATGWTVFHRVADNLWVDAEYNYDHSEVAALDPRPIWEPES